MHWNWNENFYLCINFLDRCKSELTNVDSKLKVAQKEKQENENECLGLQNELFRFQSEIDNYNTLYKKKRLNKILKLGINVISVITALVTLGAVILSPKFIPVILGTGITLAGSLYFGRTFNLQEEARFDALPKNYDQQCQKEMNSLEEKIKVKEKEHEGLASRYEQLKSLKIDITTGIQKMEDHIEIHFPEELKEAKQNASIEQPKKQENTQKVKQPVMILKRGE